MTTPTQDTAVVGRPAEKNPRLTVTPDYRVSENGDSFVVTAFVPGVTPAEVETILDGEKLVVNARCSWSAPGDWTPVHREIAQADYRLVLGLDRRIDREKVKAQLTQGVLTLTLPKAAELKPRKIKIAG